MNDNIDINKLLSEIGEELCPDMEVLSAFLEDSLPEQSNQIISRHLQKCKTCWKNAQTLKEITSDAFLDSIEKGDIPPMPEKLKEKYAFCAKINSAKDRITVKTAQLFLPDHPVEFIHLEVSNLKEDNPPLDNADIDFPSSNNARIAAFASETEPSEKNPYEVIEQIALFIDHIYDLLMEKCTTLNDVRENILECIEIAKSNMDGLKIDKDTENTIISIILDSIDV